MLRKEVRDACQQGQFTIYPLENLNDAITLFTGMPAGETDAQGRYPEDSFNQRLVQQLDHFCTLRQEYQSIGTPNQEQKDHG
jgi:hypothetical protein